MPCRCTLPAALHHAIALTCSPAFALCLSLPCAPLLPSPLSPPLSDLNPMISFATCLAGLTEFPRMVLYIAAQLVGAITASYLVRHLTPSSLLPLNQLGMCSIGVDQSVSQALTLELVADVFVLFVAFGVALDDRQRQAMPSWLPPFIISTTIALLIYTTSTVSGMGNGAIAYPTRCLGPAVAMHLVTADSFQVGGVTVRNAQWIYWYVTQEAGRRTQGHRHTHKHSAAAAVTEVGSSGRRSTTAAWRRHRALHGCTTQHCRQWAETTNAERRSRQ